MRELSLKSIKIVVAGLIMMTGLLWSVFAQNVPTRVLELPPGPNNPRNSEGDFIKLKDGRILYVYSHYVGNSWSDHAPAHLASRESSDNGKTWTTNDQIVVKNEGGLNVMSVSLLRLQNGQIAMFYLRKNSTADCRPVVRFSQDECKTWSAPLDIITKRIGYYVVNNDRVIQLPNGRIVVPVNDCSHGGGVFCYLSDDNGKTWRPNKGNAVYGYKDGLKIVTQEPGVVELDDGRLMMFIRTDKGRIYFSWSNDNAETWTPPEKSELFTPMSPSTIKKIPSTGDLLLVWINHGNVPLTFRLHGLPQGTSRPECVAVSKNNGQTWEHVKNLGANDNGWYCYTALEFVGDDVLLGYSAKRIIHSRITRVPVPWLYQDAPPPTIPPRLKMHPVFLSRCSKDNVVPGPLERVEIREGTRRKVQAVWAAEPGNAEVYKHKCGLCVRLSGGTDKVVSLKLQNPIICRNAMFGSERLLKEGSYSLIMEAKINGIWQIISQQKESCPAGAVTPFECDPMWKETTSDQYRFRCTSAKGAVILEMPNYTINGFFPD